MIWWSLAIALIAAAALAGRPGAALVLAAAAAPLLAMPRRSGAAWVLCGLAPLLGVVGAAGAYPALAGQPRNWRARAAGGALGYWWLLLAQPVVGHVLWLWPAGHRLPANARWAHSLDAAAQHALAPVLSSATVEAAAVWAVACLALPWLVRGRSVRRDAVLATAWSAALLAAEELTGRAMSPHLAMVQPRGALLATLIGGALVVLARAVRGPVLRSAREPAVAV
ncbi:MAG: hypothetical protein ACYDA6_01380 [Solirubrobacteraceae bacterium]